MLWVMLTKSHYIQSPTPCVYPSPCEVQRLLPFMVYSHDSFSRGAVLEVGIRRRVWRSRDSRHCLPPPVDNRGGPVSGSQNTRRLVWIEMATNEPALFRSSPRLDGKHRRLCCANASPVIFECRPFCRGLSSSQACDVAGFSSFHRGDTSLVRIHYKGPCTLKNLVSFYTSWIEQIE